MLFSFLFGKIVNLWPMIVPNLKFLFAQLLVKLFIIDGTGKGGEGEFRRALDHRLALAIQWKGTVMALVCSELLGHCNYVDILAAPHEDSRLHWAQEDETVLGIVNVDIGCDIEDEVDTVLAVINIVLLLFDWIDLLHLEAVNLIYEPVVVRVIFLLGGLGLQNKIAELWFRLLFFLLHNSLFLLRSLDQLFAFSLFRLYLFELSVFRERLALKLARVGVETVGCRLYGSILMVFTFVIDMNLICENVVFTVNGVILGRCFSNSMIFNFESLLVHVVGKVFVLSPLRTRTNTSHLNI
jgi:hypothetical protein